MHNFFFKHLVKYFKKRQVTYQSLLGFFAKSAWEDNCNNLGFFSLFVPTLFHWPDSRCRGLTCNLDPSITFFLENCFFPSTPLFPRQAPLYAKISTSMVIYRAEFLGQKWLVNSNSKNAIVDQLCLSFESPLYRIQASMIRFEKTKLRTDYRCQTALINAENLFFLSRPKSEMKCAEFFPKRRRFSA